MTELYPDVHRLGEGGSARYLGDPGAYALALFDLASDLLESYPRYPGWCEGYAAFTETYLHALRLDVLAATRARNAFRLSQLVEDVEEVVRELQRRVDEPARTA